jgi:UDP-glucose 4-epimerase
VTRLRHPRLLVTGAGGFVFGTALPIWRALGYQVIALDQHFSAQQRARFEGIRLVEGDVEHILPRLAPVDAVVHGAAVTASPEECGMTPEAHLLANLTPALRVFEWAATGGVRRVIGVSSGAVFTSTSGVVGEDQPVTPQGTYATAKAALEAHAATLRTQYGRDVLMVRLGNLYGPDERASASRPRLSLIGRMLSDALERGCLRLPDPALPDPHRREWTYAPDIASAIHALLQAEWLQHPLYQLAAGALADRFQIARIIQAALPDVRVETGEQDDLPALTRRGVLSHARLLQDTGFNAWTPLERGLQQALATARPQLAVAQ